jgi:hypothetical protein
VAVRFSGSGDAALQSLGDPDLDDGLADCAGQVRRPLAAETRAWGGFAGVGQGDGGLVGEGHGTAAPGLPRVPPGGTRGRRGSAAVVVAACQGSLAASTSAYSMDGCPANSSGAWAWSASALAAR